MQGGKAGEDSHRKFNAGWKTGRPWLDFRKVTTTDHDSAGNSVLVTAMFCKWCEMAGFKHNYRDKPTVCVCVRATSICVRENLHLHFLIFVCVCACNREGTSHTSSRVDGRLE
jgi:hypothetical protein